MNMKLTSAGVFEQKDSYIILSVSMVHENTSILSLEQKGLLKQGVY